MKKVFIAIAVIIIIAAIIFEFWVMTTYGNKSLSEVPFWVAWLILG